MEKEIYLQTLVNLPQQELRPAKRIEMHLQEEGVESREVERPELEKKETVNKVKIF
jgi:hypothetical protein